MSLALVVVVFTAQFASADSLTLYPSTDWTANATFNADGGNWSLTMSFNNKTGAPTTLNSFSVQLFNSGSGEDFNVSTATLLGVNATVNSVNNGYVASNNWEYFSDDKLNNGSTANCNTHANGGWLCVDSSTTRQTSRRQEPRCTLLQSDLTAAPSSPLPEPIPELRR